MFRQQRRALVSFNYVGGRKFAVRNAKLSLTNGSKTCSLSGKIINNFFLSNLFFFFHWFCAQSFSGKIFIFSWKEIQFPSRRERKEFPIRSSTICNRRNVRTAYICFTTSSRQYVFSSNELYIFSVFISLHAFIGVLVTVDTRHDAREERKKPRKQRRQNRMRCVVQ